VGGELAVKSQSW